MKDLNINIWNILILLGIIQGIIFGIIVLANKKYKSTTNSFLAYTAFSMSFSNLQYWFTDTGLSKVNVFLEWIRIPCEFLMIPMFYFFVNLYLDKTLTFKKRVLILLPFFIDLFLQAFISFNCFILDEKLISKKIVSKYFFIEEITSLTFSLSLIISTLSIINRYEKENKEFNLENVKAKTKWIKQILTIGLFSCAFWVIQVIIMNNNHSSLNIYYPIWICVSFVIYWLSYVGLFNSSLYLERKSIRKDLIIENVSEKVIKLTKKLNNQSQDIIFDKFESLMQKHFMNPNLSLEDIANKLEISPNYLSQIINSKEIRFNDYLNIIRIEKVKKMLEDDSFSKYTITAIGLEAGFNSNASFYRAFKKHTNTSPSDYRISK